MRTAVERAKVMKQFLEIAQPLPVVYSYTKKVADLPAFISYRSLGSPVITKSVGGKLINERESFLITITTKTARENLIYSDLIKLATEGTRIQYVSESLGYNSVEKSKATNSIVLYLFGDIEPLKKVSKNNTAKLLGTVKSNYQQVASANDLDIDFNSSEIPNLNRKEYSYENIIKIKKEYLDRLIEEEASIESPMNVRTRIGQAQLVKTYLQTVQPLEVKYGYKRGVESNSNVITFMDVGTSSVRLGIDNSLISERVAYIITVRTKTAKENMFYSELVKLGTEGTGIEFMSEDLRKDGALQSRWINSIIVSVFNNLHATKVVYTADEVRNMMQSIADLYIFVTSIYKEDAKQSFIDELVVPQLEDRLYTLEEFLAYKKEYLDRLLYKTTKY